MNETPKTQTPAPEVAELPAFSEPWPVAKPGETKQAYQIRLAGYQARRDAWGR